jgi:hypothetical protein
VCTEATTGSPTTATTLIAEVATAAGSASQEVEVDTDSLYIIIDVTSISGSLTVTTYTYTDDITKLTQLDKVESLATTTDNPVIRKVNRVQDNVLVEVTYDAAVTYSVKYRAAEENTHLDLSRVAVSSLPTRNLISYDQVPSYHNILVQGRTAVGDAAWTDLWNNSGVYTWLTAAGTLEAISTSTNDTAAGTGARTIVVEGLDANYEFISATISMNGTSATTATSLSFLRVFKAYVATSGTAPASNAGANIGTITVRRSGAGATQLIIPVENTVGLGQSAAGRYTVPAGHTGIVTGIMANVDSNKTADIYIFSRSDGSLTAAPYVGRRIRHKIAGLKGPFNTSFDSSIKYTEKTDIWASSYSAAANTGIEVAIELLLVNNNDLDEYSSTFPIGN